MPDVAGHFEGTEADGGGLLQPDTGEIKTSHNLTPEETILALFKFNIGQAMNTGLIIAGQNNGQPRLVMDSVYSGSWDAASSFIDSLLAEADTFQAAFSAGQPGTSVGQPSPFLSRPSTQDPSHGRDFGGAVTGRTQPFAGSEDDRGQRAGDGAGTFRRPTPPDVLRPADSQRSQELGGQFSQGPTLPNSKFKDGRDYYLLTVEGIREMEGKVWDFYRGVVSFDIGDLRLDGLPSGGGRRGPTATEIRNQFDLDKLTRDATNIFRTLLLTDDVDTRPMAKAYIEAVVATKGEKEINFIEFITKKAEATDRYASIYRTKPGSMTSAQYLAPYFQAAQVAGPGAAAGVAIEGAQFGSDPATFSARLRRTDAVTSSSNFITELQGRLSALNKVFKG